MGAQHSRQSNNLAVELELTKRKHLQAVKELAVALEDLERARERIRNLEIILYDTPRD